jgi:pseudouridine synthase
LIRLQKYLADCGVASRRKAEEYILSGLVTVNGKPVTELGVKIDPSLDAVDYNGKPVSQEKKAYVMLHKPEGYVSTAADEHNRPTVAMLVSDVPARLSPVGRLDYSTSGLILLTNDGDLLYRLTHPKHEIAKTYIVRVAGVPDSDSLRKLRDGVLVDERITAPAKVTLVKSDGINTSLRITIHEGRNRQVRKMCAAIGHDVLYLKRISTGKLALGDLPKGQWRYLTGDEVDYLKGL